MSGPNLSLYENFIESIAHVLSQALTDDETEKLLSSFTALQQRLRQLSTDNLRRLEAQTRVKKVVCKHPGPCASNALRAVVRSFIITYGLKYALGFVPAILTGKAFKEPRVLLKIGGRDTTSFALFMSFFIATYKGMLCTLRNLRQKNDRWNAFIAGCFAGTSILLDANRSRRTMIALYLSTRTGHFLSRWVWRAHLSKWVDKLGFRNPNAGKAVTAASGGAMGKVGDVHITNGEMSVGIRGDEQLVLSDGRGPRLLGDTERRTSGVSGSVNGLAQGSRGAKFSMGPASTLTSREAELAEFEDVDDHHHTHHPLRKFIRQTSGVLVMMISSAQILNAFLCEPDTLAKPYYSFLLTHGGMRASQPTRPHEFLAALSSTVKACPNMKSTKYLPIPDGAPFEDSLPPGLDLDMVLKFKDYLGQHKHENIMCSFQHAHTTSCWTAAAGAFSDEWVRALSLYAPLNAVMTVIFRGTKIIKSPTKSAINYAKSTLRSTLFLTCYVASARSVLCLFRNLAGHDRSWMYYVNGLIAGSMVLIEVPGRRLELGLYCLPRAIESLWHSLGKRGYVRNIPYGEAVYFCLSTGVLMTLYQSDPGSIHEGYRKVMYRFFGVN
ncbi:hypothetical protein BC831DRAFT_448558 [Entophlyctis helioformis]|nr:hypothetical protein BC831DRAFT_448558 [Entophlyctis helioformis]